MHLCGAHIQLNTYVRPYAVCSLWTRWSVWAVGISFHVTASVLVSVFGVVCIPRYLVVLLAVGRAMCSPLMPTSVDLCLPLILIMVSLKSFKLFRHSTTHTHVHSQATKRAIQVLVYQRTGEPASQFDQVAHGPIA